MRKIVIVALVSFYISNVYGQLPTYYGSFTVGGNSSSYYPVLFSVNGVDGTSSLGKLSVYIDNVHTNGLWSGMFHSEIEFIASNCSHLSSKIVSVTYLTGNGSPYNDPIGDIQDVTSLTCIGGSQMVIWLKGGATYQWSAPLNSRISLIDANTTGISKNVGTTTLSLLTEQSQLVINTKNNKFYQSVGLGTAGNAYFGGNVGIGILTPQTKLDIAGNIKLSNWDNSSIFLDGHSLFFGGQQSYAHVTYTFRPNWGTQGATFSHLQLQSADIGGNFTTVIQFSTNGSNSFINSGNLLIGKTSQLNSNYKLDVAGNIRANKVVVNTTGADFVFDSSYQLAPLNDVAKYIQ